MFKKSILAVAMFTLAALGVGCVDSAGPEANDPALTTLSVTLAASSVQVGQQTTATAAGVDQNGTPISTGPVTWSSTAQATTAQDGHITAVSEGQATITAIAGNQTATATLTIIALPATAVALSTAPPASAINREAFAQQPAVKLVNANGGTVAQAGVIVTASVSNGALIGAATATTDANGIATFANLGLSGIVGSRTLSFSATGITAATASTTLTAGAPASIAVSAGNQQTADAGALVAIAPVVLVTDADANAVPNVSVVFDVTAGAGSAAGSPATTNALGIATLTSWRLGAPGLNSLQAHAVNGTTGVGFSALATQAPVVTTVNVVVTPTSIQVGQAAQATASAIDQYGANIATGPITWSASSGIATVTANGVVTGVSPGQVVVTAIAGGKTGQAIVSVFAVPVLTTLSVSVTPSAILAGQTAQASVVGTDQFGAPIAVGAIAWASSSVAATVSTSGLVTGVSAGSAAIIATSSGKTAQAQVTVGSAPNAPVLTSIELTLGSSSIQVGATTQATVVGRDQNGSSIATGPLMWTSSGGATVSASGFITGMSAGQATIVATALNGVAISTTVTVTAAPPSNTPTLTSIVVTLGPSTIISGEVSQATAQGFDQNGAPIATGPITWSNGNIIPFLTISSTGLITTREFVGGVTPIIVTSGSVSGAATLTIRYPVSVSVSVSKTLLLVGETAIATYFATDQFGNPVAFPITASINCPGGCLGAASIVNTSPTTATVTAVREGAVNVVARSASGPGGIFLAAVATINIDVPPYLANLAVTWPSSLVVGQPAHVDVQGIDHRGHPFPLAPGTVLYETHPPAVASITQTGDITPNHPTLVVVKVSAQGRNGEIPYLKQYDVTGPITARLVVTSVPAGSLQSRVPISSPIVVQIVDANGVPINWVSNGITATLTSGGGTLSGEVFQGTNFQGFGLFDDLTVSGSAGQKTITFSGLAVNPVAWNFTLGPSAPINISVNAGNNQTAVMGAAVAVNPSVKVTDIDGNAVSGVAVNFTVTGGGGSLTGATAATDANGIAQVGSWTLGSVGANTLRAQATGVSPTVTFTATATASIAGVRR